MATQRELLDPFGSAIKRGMTRTVPEAPKAAPVPYRADFEPSKMPAVKKPVEDEIAPEDFDEPMVTKLSEVKAKGVPHDDAIEIVRALKDRGTVAPKTEEPKDDGKVASGTELIAGIGVEAPAFVGRTLAGISKLGSYVNPMTYLSETQKARGEAGAKIVEDEGIRQSKAQEEAFKEIGIDTTSKMGEFGKGITKYGIPAVIPVGGGAMATGIKGLAAQGAKYGAAGGAIQSVTERGAELTPTGLAKDTAIAAGAGAVLNPVFGKAVVPVIGKVAEKAVKYGTALEKVGLQGLGMSVSRDYARKTASKAVDAIPDTGAVGKNVFGEKIEIPPPEKKGLYEGAMQKIANVGKPQDIGNLVNRSLGTKQRGTTVERIAKIGGEGYVNDLETLHGMVRSGEIEGSLGSVYEGAQAVQSGLRKVGAEIGEHLKSAGLDSTVPVEAAIAKLDNIIADSREAVANPEMINIAKKYKQLLIDHNNLQDIQATKQDLFQDLANLKKDNAGRASYKNLMEAGTEVINSIDKKVQSATGAGKAFMKAKQKYKSLKNIEKDITDSAVVAERRSPQGLIEQLADMRAGDFVLNPVTAAKSKIVKDLGKAISERNSRDGTFRQAIEYFDRNAIKRGSAGGNDIPQRGGSVQQRVKKALPALPPASGKTQGSFTPIKGKMSDAEIIKRSKEELSPTIKTANTLKVSYADIAPYTDMGGKPLEGKTNAWNKTRMKIGKKNYQNNDRKKNYQNNDRKNR